MRRISPFRLLSKASLSWSAAFGLSFLSICSIGGAADGTFIIPSIRAESGTDFAYWDLFKSPPNGGFNYNFENLPGQLPPDEGNDPGTDADGNPSTVFEDPDNNPATPAISRTVLIQNGATDAFMTGSNAIYSFAQTAAFEVPYTAPIETGGEVTNVIFQTQTGGMRLNVNTVQLVYVQDGLSYTVNPVFRGMDDQQTGAFNERIVCAFQWNLTGLNVRNFKIVFAAPSSSMPLWEAQLDVDIGDAFHQELGYLLATRSRPFTRYGRMGTVDKNLPISADGRYFFQGDELNLLADPETGWRNTGWYYDGTITRGLELPLTFPANDITVTALFAPTSYSYWRTLMFYHRSSVPEIGTGNDYLDDAISAADVDHDGDGLTNAGEYAFAGDPYADDAERTRPQLLIVADGGIDYLALRYRTNGLTPGQGDVVQTVRVSDNGSPWKDNSIEPTTITVARELLSDGSELVTERTVQPFNSFTAAAMDVAWRVGGNEGTPQAPAELAIVSVSPLASARMGTSYSRSISASGGIEPYAWQVTSGTPPPGLTLSAGGILSGTPTTVGEYTFTAQVSDAASDTETTEFTVTVLPYEITNSATLAAHQAGNAALIFLDVIGGTGPYTWQHSSGELPAGMQVSTDGQLFGTPTEGGSFEFTIQVEDDNDLVTSKTFQWQVIDLQITTEDLPLAVSGTAYNVALTASGGTGPYTWSLPVSNGLPAGLTLSPAGVISGTTSAIGTAHFTVRVMETSHNFISTQDFSLQVALSSPTPVINQPSFPISYPGANFDYTVTATNHPDQFIITGLPKGFKYVAATGQITGRTTVASVSLVQIRAVNSGGSSATLNVPLIVKPLPTGLVGSFTGLAARNDAANAELGSQIDLVTTTTGAFTVKVKSGTATKSAKGFMEATAPQVRVPVNGIQLNLTLNANTQLMSGTYGAAAANGWRLIWDKKFNPASTREGYYSVALDLADAEDLEDTSIPQGVGFATFSILPAGTLKVTGKTADGLAITAATTLGPHGELAVYAGMYGGKGSLFGEWRVAEDEDGLFIDNDVTGVATWKKPVTKGRTYAAEFGAENLTVNLNVEGGYLAPTAKGPVVLGLPDTGAVDLVFEGGGIEESDTVANVIGAAWTENYTVDFSSASNPAKVALKVNKANGSLTGTFSLTETTPVLVRKGVKFSGQIVRLSHGETKAAGWFLLPQIPGPNEKASATPILSGALLLNQSDVR